MPSLTYVQLWELWRISRKEILWRLLLLTVLPCWAQWDARDIPYGSSAVLGVFVWLIAFSSVFSTTWMNSYDNTRAGFSLYLGFTRPISTLQLVAIPMVYNATMSALCYVFSVKALGLVAQQPVPVFPAATYIAAIVFLLNTAVWSQQSRVRRTVAFILTALTISAISISALLKNEERFAETLTNSEMLGALLAIAVASIAVTAFCVGRQRHGLEWGFRWPSFDRSDWSGRLMRREGPFQSAVYAQFWFEMRRAGIPILTISVVVTALALILAGVMQVRNPNTPRTALIWLYALTTFVPSFLCVGSDWLSGLRNKQGARSLSTFDATQPVAHGRISAIKLTVLIVSVFLGWILLILAASVWISLFGLEQWSTLSPEVQFRLSDLSSAAWWTVGIAFAANYLALAAFFFVLGLFGSRHPMLIGSVVFVHCGLVVLSLFARLRFGWHSDPLWTGYATLFAAALVGGTLVAFYRGIARGYLSKGYVAVSVILWIGYLYAIGVLYEHAGAQVHLSLTSMLLGVGVLMLPLLTPALVPFTYAAHRHR